ncbi:MAG: HEAT repeat domain-containing protein [Deltaproteobacteria bacterium]|nr:HEAT repeat domain-containing protein [Deltaproteobacteria bacterium]
MSLAACAGPSALRPARSGDVAALRAALDADLRAGRLTRSAVGDIAEALASHELQSAKGNDALQRVQQVRSCARHLQDGLVERTKGTDLAAPEAALILEQSHLTDFDKWRARSADPDPMWRAVGVRTLTDPESANQRRAAMLDPDENVRLAAVRAAEDARDAGDGAQLIDVARLDPNALVRVTAVRALGQLGSPEMVLRLKDMMTNGSDAVRQSIVVAWSWPGMLEAGGQRELILIAETGKDEAAVLAGGILLRLGAETRGTGISTLLKHIDGSAARARVLAISLAPIDDPAVRQAVSKLSTTPDPEVKLAALTSLARDPAERAKALDGIGSLAASSLPVAAKAKATMARLGDARVTALLLKDGESKVAETRVDAARGLIELGDIARAAMFLADADAGVRTRTACQILVASERW